jgi:phage tail sheath protein FI
MTEDGVAGTNYDEFDNGDDGIALDDTYITGGESSKTGIYALEKADLFNLLCIPPRTREIDVDPATTLSDALTYCKKRRAILIVDPPSGWNETSDVEGVGSTTGVGSLGLTDKNAVIYFPRIKVPDKLKEYRLETFVPCGAVAGIMARTDAQRGVWKAPAGQDAKLVGVTELTVKLTDGENGRLNPLGVNCLRTFPVYGNIVWGARTLEGADKLASEWKYVPVRRTALFIEESLYRGTKWVVFEPNDEPLWAQIRLNIGAFMHDLFVKGAFQGTSPKDAYFVKCDKETTTQNDIDKGIVNILVGFAPLKPAEFVMIKIQQMAGNIQT